MTNTLLPLSNRATAKLLVLVALLLSFAGGVRGQIFTDWTSIDNTTRIVSGTLGSTSVTFAWTSAGDTSSTVLNGSSNYFASAAFTPALATSDAVLFLGNSTSPVYTITFGVPVLNPILHFASEGSTLDFGSATPNFISGDGHLSVSGNQVLGADIGAGAPNNDANGTINFLGTYSSLSFTAYWVGGPDGIALQVGATAIPEPAADAALLGAITMGFVLARRKRRTA